MMDQVSLYIYTTVKGPGVKSGTYTYLLEYITKKGPVTLTKCGMLESATEHQAQLIILREAMQRIKKPCEVEIYTDSVYLQQGAEVWLKGWQAAGWINAKGKPVANRKEWEQLAELLGRHLITFRVGEEHSYKIWIRKEAEKREKERSDNYV